jgi:hypothetical protein
LPVPLYVLGVVAAMVGMWEAYAATAVVPGVFTALFVLTGLSAIGLLVSALSPRRSLIDLCYYLFLTFFVTGPAAIQVATWDFPWTVKHDYHHAAVATLLLALAMVAYEVGGAVGRRVQGPGHGPGARLAPTQGLLAVLVVGVAAGSVVIPLAGLELLLADRAAFSDYIVSGIDGYVVNILKGVALATTVWALATVYSVDPARDSATKRWTLAAVTVAAVALTALLFNPLVNPRFFFGAAAIALLFLVTRPYFFELKPWAVLGFPAALFYVFPNLKLLSYEEGRTEIIERLGQVDLEYLTRVDFDTFQTASNAVRFVEEVGLLGIQNLLGSLLFFVPRVVWPDKPIGSGLVVFEHLGYPYVNVSMPLHLEFYLIAGIAGLILGMVGFGVLVGWLETASLQTTRLVGRTRFDVFIALVGGFAIIVLRGPLVAVAAFVGVPLGWAALVLLLSRSRAAVAPPREPEDAGAVAGDFGDWRDAFTGRRRPETALPRRPRAVAVVGPARRSGADARSGSRGG